MRTPGTAAFVIRSIVSKRTAERIGVTQIRNFTAAKAPGSDPLELLRKTSEDRNLCDATGFRRPGIHWVFNIAATNGDITQPPSLRTLGFQRATAAGVDFVTKIGSASDLLTDNKPVSFLYRHGKYKAGETVEQWRAEGFCYDLDLDELLHHVPHYTITGMVASKRAEKELAEKEETEQNSVSAGRLVMERQTHFVELIQATRVHLENGEISKEELAESLRAFRFKPTRVERMVGGPDAVMWDRWEWLRENEDANWSEPNHLLPY